MSLSSLPRFRPFSEQREKYTIIAHIALHGSSFTYLYYYINKLPTRERGLLKWAGMGVPCYMIPQIGTI